MRASATSTARTASTDFTIDAAARHDIPAAIAADAPARCHREDHGVVGHCMGGAIVTQGIVQGVLPASDVENVVITALGLFYRAAIDNVLKAEDGVLEELLFDRHQDLLHPTKKWATNLCQQDPVDGDWDRPPSGAVRDLEGRRAARPTAPSRSATGVSYMFGMPYIPDNIPAIHASSSGALQFRHIPVQFLLHCWPESPARVLPGAVRAQGPGALARVTGMSC